MHVQRLRRRTPVALAVATLALLALAGEATAVPARDATLHLGGTWAGTYSGAVSGKFTLTWTQIRGGLHGSITLSRPQGKYGIAGRLTRTGIKFGAVAVGATYTGTVAASGLRMSGKWTSPQGGGSWSAHKLLTKKKKV